MKVKEQILINQEVEEVIHDLLHCIEVFGAYKVRQLRSCSAEIYETNGYHFLKSYNTVIACIGDENNVCYDFLRLVYGYTATSAKHITKFMQDYNSTEKRTYRPV